MPTLDDISLRKSDRATLVGASGTGKSTLARFLLISWQETFCHPRISPKKRGRLLIADTKPRWRGTVALTGQTVTRRYKGFVKGDTIPGAVIVSSLKDWKLAWDMDLNPSQTVILQNTEVDEEDNVRWQVEAIALFFKEQRDARPSLLYVDEGMDFYGPTGNARFGNAIQRCFRAGREKGLATLLGVQRPKSINLQTLTEANVLYLFRLDFVEDVKRLQEMGYPKTAGAPDEDHRFRYMRGRALYPNPLILPKGAI